MRSQAAGKGCPKDIPDTIGNSVNASIAISGVITGIANQFSPVRTNVDVCWRESRGRSGPRFSKPVERQRSTRSKSGGIHSHGKVQAGLEPELGGGYVALGRNSAVIRVELPVLVFIYLIVFLTAIFSLWIVYEWLRRSREKEALRYRVRCSICASIFEDKTNNLLPRCPRCGSLNERYKIGGL